MLKQACFFCKIVGILAIIGVLNWGSIAVFQVNFIDRLFGEMSIVSRVLYGLIGLSGIALLISFFTTCPACKKS